MVRQLISLAGAFLVLGAYLGYQRGWLDRSDRSYNVMNLVGSALLLWAAILDRSWGFTLLNAVWVVVSFPPSLHPPEEAKAG